MYKTDKISYLVFILRSTYYTYLVHTRTMGVRELRKVFMNFSFFSPQMVQPSREVKRGKRLPVETGYESYEYTPSIYLKIRNTLIRAWHVRSCIF